MRRTAATLGACCAALVMTAAPASAEYHFTERGAMRVTKDAVHKEYGYSRTTLGVSCRPQGLDRADSAYKYHRWVCAWAARAKDRCEDGESWIVGRVVLTGREGVGTYSYRVQNGATCDDLE